MTSQTRDAMLTLMRESLAAWGVAGRAEPTDDGAIRVVGASRSIRIDPAADGLPFRWLVSVDGRRRSAVSLVAVLRQVRGALDLGYSTTRVRIARSPDGAPAVSASDPPYSSNNQSLGGRTR